MAYIGVVDMAPEDGSYWVYFPEVKGCFACADTIDELPENSKAALNLYFNNCPPSPKLGECDVRLSAATDLESSTAFLLRVQLSSDVSKRSGQDRTVSCEQIVALPHSSL